MKLNLQSIQNKQAWAGYHLPAYDPAAIAANTKKAPRWLHFGPGNIFRIFPAALCQALIEQGEMDSGIVCVEGYDEEVITRAFRPYDNLTLAVTLMADGNLEKEIIGSMAEALILSQDLGRVTEIFENPTLQMVSFTITEKGYSLYNADHALFPAVAEDIQKGPASCKSFMATLAALCLKRKAACGKPLALVSMDNCSHNGEKLQNALLEIAGGWLNNGHITADDYDYLKNGIACPWSMIDKITPRPHPAVEQKLTEDGVEEMSPIITAKNTYTAPFVNAEKPQYLVIEDRFPNGRPPLEKAGVIITDRDTVNKVEKMKVCTCLNPLHTCLAIYGCILGHTSIAAETKDPELAAFIEKMSREEGMPYVVDPKVIEPKQFLKEVVEVRLPNPFMPDTPQRIATDTSQKLSIRYGETVKAVLAAGNNPADLTLIPLVQAGWLRYLLGVDDEGAPFELSPDPLLPAMQQRMEGIALGKEFDAEQLKPILSDAAIFGLDLYECGLAEKVLGYFRELIAGPGAVRATLKKYVY